MWWNLVSWGIGVVIFVAICSWVYRFLNWKALGIPTLRCTVATPDEQTFDVFFERLQPDVQPMEYVRLVLSFAAKMIFNLMPRMKDHVAIRDEFLACMRKLASTLNTNDVDVIRVCGFSIEAREVGQVPHHRRHIVGTLGFRNIRERVIYTSIPNVNAPQLFLPSWLALVATALPKIDASSRKQLQRSLDRMADIYQNDPLECSRMLSVVSVPTRAFDEAYFAEP